MGAINDFDIHVFVKTGSFRDLCVFMSFQRILGLLLIFPKFGMMNCSMELVFMSIRKLQC